MFKIIAILICINNVYGYFTLPEKCPKSVKVQEDFRLSEFFGKWYQSYHYSSDGQHNNNCSVLELINKPNGIHLNQSRVDRGLFHRFSIASLEIPVEVEDAANLDVTFVFNNAPRRLTTRRYPFRILATNYNYYATIYTCQYSPLIDKHFVYVWLLSRQPLLNDVSKTLAIKSLQQMGITSELLLKDDWSKCSPKYYEDDEKEPTTFRYPVPI